MGKLHAIQKSSSRPLVWAEVSGNHLRWFSTKSKYVSAPNESSIFLTMTFSAVERIATDERNL